MVRMGNMERTWEPEVSVEPRPEALLAAGPTAGASGAGVLGGYRALEEDFARGVPKPSDPASRERLCGAQPLARQWHRRAENSPSGPGQVWLRCRAGAVRSGRCADRIRRVGET